MNGHELIARLRKLGSAKNTEVRLVLRQGKGSHARLYFGDRFTTLKDRRKEIGPGLLRKMLRDLGIDEL